MLHQYSTIGKILKPEQILAYRVARWFVSGAGEVRQSGRTLVLAAAHIHEVLEGRSTKLWDHYDTGRTSAPRIICETIRELCIGMSLTPIFTENDTVFRKVETRDDRAGDPKEVLDQPLDLVRMEFAQSVRDAYNSGLSEREILDITIQATREELVASVHNL